MESRVIDGLTLFFPAEERAAAELIGRACTAGITLIGNLWGVSNPEGRARLCGQLVVAARHVSCGALALAAVDGGLPASMVPALAGACGR